MGPDWSTVPVFEDLAEAFVRVAERARDPAGASGALVLVGPAGDEPAAAELRDTFGRHGIKVFDSRGFSDAEVVIASAVRTVAEHQGRMYDLDLDTALTMLNSLALAFHGRYFHREEVGSEAGEQRLFDLGEDLPDGRMSVARATFVHVRRLCEWIFAGPIRSYLDGGEDPTRVDPRPREASGQDLADETGRSSRRSRLVTQRHALAVVPFVPVLVRATAVPVRGAATRPAGAAHAGQRVRRSCRCAGGLPARARDGRTAARPRAGHGEQPIRKRSRDAHRLRGRAGQAPGSGLSAGCTYPGCRRVGRSRIPCEHELPWFA